MWEKLTHALRKATSRGNRAKDLAKSSHVRFWDDLNAVPCDQEEHLSPYCQKFCTNFDSEVSTGNKRLEDRRRSMEANP